MKRKCYILLFIAACFFAPFSPCSAFDVSHEVSVSVYIGGEHTFSLFGYSSPDSKISISSLGVFDETTSDSSGYFLFKDKPSSLYHQELCLSAQDGFGRVSSPICIPPIPSENNLTIGPVILPPTISLNNGAFFIGEEPILSGQTIPNTDVKLSLFTDETKNKGFIAFKALVSPVEAYTIPTISIKTDKKGYFSVALSSTQAKYYRLFAQSFYLKSISPKSNTLHLDIMPFWTYLLQLFGFLWKAFQRYLLDFVIFSQIVSIAFFLLYKYLRPFFHQRRKLYTLALRPPHELIIEHIPLMKRGN